MSPNTGYRHKEAEWAYVLEGKVRITALDYEGASFFDDLEKGDLWYFPSGVPHSLQGLSPPEHMPIRSSAHVGKPYAEYWMSSFKVKIEGQSARYRLFIAFSRYHYHYKAVDSRRVHLEFDLVSRICYTIYIVTWWSVCYRTSTAKAAHLHNI